MVWCYHPVTRGSSVIYKHMEPIRDEVMPFLDFMLDGILPASSKPSGQPAAQKKTNKAENQYVPSGITVHLDSLEMTQVEGSAEDGTASADVPVWCIGN